MQDWLLAKGLQEPSHVYDTEAKQPPGFGGYGRTLPGLLFPNVTSWDQLFQVWTTDKAHAPVPYIVYGVEATTYPENQRRDPQIGPYMTLDTARCGGTRYGSAWVRGRDELHRALVSEMLCMRGDTISYNVVAWDRQRAIVVAHYSLILGDHWIAIIDPETIPEELRHAPSEHERLRTEAGH